jgi:DNA polymerase-1
VEADDVMGTLAHHATQAKMDALLSTGDKDMAQLVNQHITLVNTMTDTLMTPEKVEEKFHVKPDQIIDYLALMGDSSDNIPGIPKCGPKTAAKWLAEYGDIDNLIAHADDIKGKIGENLRANLDQLKLSRELTTIRIDCDLPIALADIKRHEADMDALESLFARFDLRNWLSRVLKGDLPFSQSSGRKAHSQTKNSAPKGVSHGDQWRDHRIRTLCHDFGHGRTGPMAEKARKRRGVCHRYRNHLAQRDAGQDRRHQFRLCGTSRKNR